jgi:hypothetical protein
MIYRIAEDVVERRLELIGRRGIAPALVQAVLAIIIVGFVGSFLTMAAAQMVAKLPADWLGRFDCWWRLIAALLILGVPALLIGGAFLRLVMAMSDGWRRLTWDSRAGELIAVRRGGLFGFSRQQTIPLAEINRIDLHASPGGRNLALKLIVRFAKDLNRKHVEFEVNVQHVDRREEAMDLLFRIARMCRLAYYAVEDSGPRYLKLRVVREPQSSNKFQPIPESGSAARYAEDVVSPAVQAPEIRVARFRPQDFGRHVSGVHLAEWEPGKRIRFHQLPPDVATYGITAAIAAVVAGILAYNLAPLAAEWLPGWGTMVLAIVVSALGACVWVSVAGREREVIFDWPTKQATWRVGRRLRQAPLGAIERLVLRGVKRTERRQRRKHVMTQDRLRVDYWCRLEMSVQGRTIFILQSNRVGHDADAPPQQLGPLAAALAESLGVPWQWRDYDA